MSRKRLAQSGAALLTAMLTVTLVATFAAAALWQQWRAVEVESAERARVQSTWVLVGALDWARLILREDGRIPGPDHLAEPWAIPLEEAKLTSFLAADKNIAADALEGLPDAYLAGRIVDAQSKLNVMKLLGSGGKPYEPGLKAFAKLFEMLGLPASEVQLLAANLRRANAGNVPPPPGNPGTGNNPDPNAGTPPPSPPQGGGGGGGDGDGADSDNGPDTAAPLMPQHAAQLVWLGLSPSTAAALEPYVTVLPTATAVNINTASAEVLYASVPQLDMAGAKRLVAQRSRRHFTTLAEANQLLPETAQLNAGSDWGVGTEYFEVYGRLRIDNTWVDERSLVYRKGIEVRTIWRERGAGATLPQAKP